MPAAAAAKPAAVPPRVIWRNFRLEESLFATQGSKPQAAGDSMLEQCWEFMM
jgi:hypothetical protein